MSQPVAKGRLAQRGGGREAEIAAVAADVLGDDVPATVPPPGRVLVAGDHDGAVEEALAGGGVAASSWHRMAYDGRTAAPAPPDGPFDGAVLRLPRGWGAFAVTLHALAARLPAGAPLWIYGGNDEGIASLSGRLDGLVESPETLAIKRRTRVLRCRRAGGVAAPRGALEAWRETVSVTFPGAAAPTELVSYPGLFAHGRLDPGTACLLEVLPRLPEAPRILDFGCGGGAIARAVRERCPGADLTLLEVDAVALHAAAQNVPGATLVASDGWSGLATGRQFDLILSNPPLHRGKEEDFGTLDALVRGAAARLRPRGALIAVMQRTAGAGALFQGAFRAAELLATTPQYQVWRGAV